MAIDRFQLVMGHWESWNFVLCMGIPIEWKCQESPLVLTLLDFQTDFFPKPMGLISSLKGQPTASHLLTSTHRGKTWFWSLHWSPDNLNKRQKLPLLLFSGFSNSLSPKSTSLIWSFNDLREEVYTCRTTITNLSDFDLSIWTLICRTSL